MTATLPAHIRIPAGYSAACTGSVYSILNKSFKSRLDEFTDRFSAAQLKAGQPSLPSHLVAAFPFVEYPPLRHEIFSRKKDLELLDRLLKSAPRGTVLEIGSWNGWLSSWLQKRGYKVTATDIFMDEANGLLSRRHHPLASWTSVQADLSDPSIFCGKFDLIIFNHCVQFLPRPTELISHYSRLLSGKGMLIILGFAYNSDPNSERKKVAAYRKKFFSENGFPINFYESAGFVEPELLNFLKAKGFSFKRYPVSPFKTLLSKLKGELSGIAYFQKKPRDLEPDPAF